MEGWAGNGIYSFRTAETLATMLLQRLAESGCLSDECGSGTHSPKAGSILGAPGPGSVPAVSHFPASVYG